mgnify:CR=1 FL=1
MVKQGLTGLKVFNIGLNCLGVRVREAQRLLSVAFVVGIENQDGGEANQ